MALYHTIQEKLVQLNDATFEYLCNDFFPHWRAEYKNFHPNTVVGKVKTRKGKPDAYAILADNSYVLFEYTTSNEHSLYNKLRKDLMECLKLASTKFKGCKIDRIILCFNGRLLDPAQSNELLKIAREEKQFVEIVALHQFCNELQKYPPLLSKHLSIELPYSQFLTPSEFVKQSAQRNFSTPLTNRFVGREKELGEINTAIENEDIIFITGKSGIGKTRISLEIIERLLKQSRNIEAYCVKYKGSDKLEEELLNVWDRSKTLILLIDDANYVKNGLLPIANLQEQTGRGKIKVLLTVRDYVFTETKQAIKDFKYALITMSSLSSKEIEDVLRNPPYKLHFKVIDRIERLTKDNTRIAMMLAEIVMKERKWAAFENSTNIYHKYFEGHLNESLLKEDETQKIIALLWLFHDFNITDDELYKRIEMAFGIGAKRIWEIIDQLYEKEILEVYAKEIAKIPEQTLGGYLFYYVFFHKKILSLKTLFEYFHETHSENIFSRIQDSIEVFDYEKVKPTLIPVLKETWDKIKDDELKSESFLNRYWFVFPSKALSYAKAKITSIPLPQERIYKAEYQDSSYFPEDKILKLVGRFLEQMTADYQTALELILEYVERKPAFAGQLTKFLVDSISYDFDDENYDYYRQKTLIKTLTDKIKPKNASQELWFGVALKFLNTEFKQASSKRRNAVSLYHYNPPLNKTVLEIRKSIFDTLLKLFDTEPDKAFKFFQDYIRSGSRVSLEAYKHDLSFIKKVIKTKLDTKNILHSYLVEDVYRRFRQDKIYNFSKEREPFCTSQFKTLLACDFRKLEGVDDYIVAKHKFENYNKLKTEEIKKKIRIVDIEHFSRFYSILEEGVKNGIIQSYFLSDCLNTVLEEIRVVNFELFIDSVTFITARNNNLSFYLKVKFENTDIGKQQFDILFKTLNKVEFNSKEDWISFLFVFANESFLSLEHGECYLSMFKDGKTYFSVRNIILERFERLKKGFILDAIKIFVNGYSEYKNAIHFDTDFVHQFIVHFEKKMDILFKFYFIREEIYSRYDFNGDDFLLISQRDRSFPIKYLEWSYKKYKTDFAADRHELDFLGVLWGLTNGEQIIEDVLNFILSKKGLWLFGAYPVNVLFKSNKSNTPELKTRIEKFLVSYTKKNYLNKERMNAVINICHHTLPQLYTKIVLAFLSKTKSLEDFKRLKWQKQYGVVSGGVVWGELYGKDWGTLLNIVNIIKPRIDFIEHVEYIEEQILLCDRSAEKERKKKFADEWYE